MYIDVQFSAILFQIYIVLNRLPVSLKDSESPPVDSTNSKTDWLSDFVGSKAQEYGFVQVKMSWVLQSKILYITKGKKWFSYMHVKSTT